MIEFKNIRKEYQTGVGSSVILKDISFRIAEGEFVLITGKSGSGKSTLLNMLTGVDTPTSGEVIVGTNSIGKFSEDRMARFRGENIGIVFQFFQLIPTLSVRENLLLPMDLVNTVPEKKRKEKAKQLLQLVGMLEHADEPTGNLDSKNAASIFELLCSLKEQGKTIVMVMHEREVMKGASRKILMKDGEIAEDISYEKEVAVQ